LEIAGAVVYLAAMLRKYLVALSIGLAVAGAALAEQPRSGVDISAIDPAVPPQQDFWQFANGKWLAATPIPADRSAWNTFAAVRDHPAAAARRDKASTGAALTAASRASSRTSMVRSWTRRVSRRRASWPCAMSSRVSTA
jgi:hypothetical protein